MPHPLAPRSQKLRPQDPRKDICLRNEVALVSKKPSHSNMPSQSQLPSSKTLVDITLIITS